MNLDLLEDFLELARELNFSRAAANRNMTQPAFSRRIRTLEEALQVPLITRTTRQVGLTSAGKAFVPRATDIVRLVAEARVEAQEAAGRAGRTLNLAATHALSYTFVPRWLMRAAAPAALGTLNMVSDTQRQCMRLIQSGDVSFFVCHKGVGQEQDLPDRQFKCHPIGEDRLVPLCAPGTDGKPLWKLGGAGGAAPFIAYGGASGLHAILERHWAAHGRPEIAQCMSSLLASANLELAKEGQGIAFLPLSLAEGDLTAKRLVRAGGGKYDVPVEVVIYRPRSRLSAHCEAFWTRMLDGAAA